MKPPDLEPTRVLVVEDNPGDADLIAEYLPDAVVTQARTLAQGLAFAGTQRFDVALVDAGLPDAGGVTAVQALSNLGLFPVILLTASEDTELGLKASRCGAHDYLVKGQFDTRRLSLAVTCSVQRHEAFLQYRTLMHESPDGVLIVDAQGVVVFCNPSAAAMFKVSVPQLMGADIGVPSGQVSEVLLISGLTAEIRTARIPWQGSPAHLVQLRDVTERVRMVAELARSHQQLEELALVDPLTGILNRRGLEGALTRLARSLGRSEATAAAILIDCDDFKGINEAGGYTAGDAALVLVARTLEATLRASTDVIGRIGGDEFLVLLPTTSLATAFVVAEKVRTAIRTAPLPVTQLGLASGVTVSLGVTAIPNGTVSLKEVIGFAQASLGRSKRAGKDRVTVEGGGVSPANDGLDLHALIKQRQCFGVAAQPIVNGERAVTAYELLTRGPAGSALELPTAIFSAARHDNLLTMVDLACLRNCLAARPLVPRGARVHLNVFPSTLLGTPLWQLLELFGGQGEGLVLELSEQEFVGDPSLLVPALAGLRGAGARIAVDDVGFGRSSLESLVVLEPDVVKIDPSAVFGVANDVGLRRSLKRLVTCLRSLGPEVIAEGIENAQDARVLEDLGISFQQGFLWGRPQALRLGTTTMSDARERFAG